MRITFLACLGLQVLLLTQMAALGAGLSEEFTTQTPDGQALTPRTSSGTPADSTGQESMMTLG